MKKPSRRKTQIAALSASISIALSGAAFAAWNPATGQASPEAAASSQPAGRQNGTSSKAITVPALSSSANPNAKPLNDGSGAGPTGGGTLGMGTVVTVINGYGITYDVASQSGMNQFYNFVVDASQQIYGELHAIYEYLAYGKAENQSQAGEGLIATINKNHDLDRKAEEEQLALNHARVQELMMKQAYANKVVSQLQDYRVCDDLGKDMSSQMAGGGGAVGRGGGASFAKSEIEADVSKVQAGNEMTQVGHTERVTKTHKDNYCSKEDLQYKDGTSRNAFNCTALSPKGMPDADARAQSVFAPAVDFNSQTAVMKQNLTYTPDQKQAASDAIKNIVAAFSPPAMPKSFEKTEQGKAFLAKTKTFNARISSAVHALSSMADRRVAMSGNASGAGGQIGGFWDWNNSDWTVTYKRIFGNQVTVPEKLSEADSLRFEVYRRYFDNPEAAGGWYQEKVVGGDDTEKLRELLRIGSGQMLLMYNIHQRLEENNMMQAAILSHMINPVTKDELQQASKAAYQ